MVRPFKETCYQMPEPFCGQWRVVSYHTPDGRSGQGAVKDIWRIRPEIITCGSSKELLISEIQSEVEEKQDVHLVLFKNNTIQFAFLRSDAKPGVVLVIQYLDGAEMLRCLLEKI